MKTMFGRVSRVGMITWAASEGADAAITTSPTAVLMVECTVSSDPGRTNDADESRRYVTGRATDVTQCPRCPPRQSRGQPRGSSLFHDETPGTPVPSGVRLLPFGELHHGLAGNRGAQSERP